MHRVLHHYRVLSGMLRRLAPTFAAVLVTGASFLPGSVKHLIHSRGALHNPYHVVAFAVLGWLLCSRGDRGSRQIVFAGWATLLGCTAEVAEAARNYAALEGNDILCDVAGVLLGLLLVWLARARLSSSPGTLRAPRLA